MKIRLRIHPAAPLSGVRRGGAPEGRVWEGMPARRLEGATRPTARRTKAGTQWRTRPTPLAASGAGNEAPDGGGG
jgi:hypothetical protein